MIDFSKVRNYYIACGYTDMRQRIVQYFKDLQRRGIIRRLPSTNSISSPNLYFFNPISLYLRFGDFVI